MWHNLIISMRWLKSCIKWIHSNFYADCKTCTFYSSHINFYIWQKKYVTSGLSLFNFIGINTCSGLFIRFTVPHHNKITAWFIPCNNIGLNIGTILFRGDSDAKRSSTLPHHLSKMSNCIAIDWISCIVTVMIIFGVPKNN